MLNEITSQDLNQVQLSTFKELSNRMRHEHRAHQAVMNSLSSQSMAKGFKNIAIIRRPDLLIKLLIEEGILPEESGLGRQKFCDMGYLERTALSAPVSFLMENEEKIKEWVEDNTEHFADDVFNILIGGAIIGSSLGMVSLASPTLKRLYSRINALPDTTSKTKVLRSKDRVMTLLSAD